MAMQFMSDNAASVHPALWRALQAADDQPGSAVDKTLAAELAHWGPIIKASGFTPQQ